MMGGVIIHHRANSLKRKKSHCCMFVPIKNRNTKLIHTEKLWTTTRQNIIFSPFNFVLCTYVLRYVRKETGTTMNTVGCTIDYDGWSHHPSSSEFLEKKKKSHCCMFVPNKNRNTKLIQRNCGLQHDKTLYSHHSVLFCVLTYLGT